MVRCAPCVLLLLGLACGPAAALQLKPNSSDQDETELLTSDRSLVVNAILKEFGSRDALCEYFGWVPRPEAERRPRIFYASIVGNEGQQDVYDLAFAEVHPLVDRIVALDPKLTHRGHPRNLSIDMWDARWRRYGQKLRHVVLESPVPGAFLDAGHSFYEFPEETREKFQRPGHRLASVDFGLEQWIRAQLYRGLQDSAGAWEMDDTDILIVADSDEIPLRESLVALSECEGRNFAGVRRRLDQGEDAKVVCAQDAKVLLRSQVFEYYLDCPTTVPVWWHPDAILAACVKNGGIDTEDVRTGSSGQMTPVMASRHIHNFAMSDEDVIYKYTHYVEPRTKGIDAGLQKVEHQEMRWRSCDPNAPELGPKDWHMEYRPSMDFIRQDNKRGWSAPPQHRRGSEKTLALLNEKPELAQKIYWEGHGKIGNPFVGQPGGQHEFWK